LGHGQAAKPATELSKGVYPRIALARGSFRLAGRTPCACLGGRASSGGTAANAQDCGVLIRRLNWIFDLIVHLIYGPKLK
jgi:hypothetical protein